MPGWYSNFAGLLTAAALAAAATPAFAAEGMASDWQVGFQNAATAIAQAIHDLDDFLLVIITLITLFVLGLLVWVMFRYNEKANPKPTTTTHNTAVEVIWTVVPVLILVVIAIPSFRLLYAQHEFPKADLTIKAIGQQWYWDYQYLDHGGFEFSSNMLEESELNGKPRLLAVDNEVVVPVGKVVHVLVTATAVMHNWTVPAFGSKIDAVPGRVTRTWFKAERVGTFYGQCSELCGKGHAFMPIAVRVVTQQEFDAWVEKAKVEFASDDSGPKPALAGSEQLETGDERRLADAASAPASEPAANR